MALVIQSKANNQVLASGQEDNDSVFIFEDNWYYNPTAVDMTYLKVTDRKYTCPYKGVCVWVDLEMPGLKARNIGWIYDNPMPGYERIKDRIAFYSRDTAGTVALRDTVSAR
ncbi:MAG: DUF427 domain-containing protein [Anaerolineae bacterium]|nr:DUF427 domain-containing protein [Anaerolineae bacterium]